MRKMCSLCNFFLSISKVIYLKQMPEVTLLPCASRGQHVTDRSRSYSMCKYFEAGNTWIQSLSLVPTVAGNLRRAEEQTQD